MHACDMPEAKSLHSFQEKEAFAQKLLRIEDEARQRILDDEATLYELQRHPEERWRRIAEKHLEVLIGQELAGASAEYENAIAFLEAQGFFRELEEKLKKRQEGTVGGSF